MTELELKIFHKRIVPVVTLERSVDAIPLVRALELGGLPVAEITLRTNEALDGIQQACGQPGVIIGAGSVMNAEQCRQALSAGAQFIVSPGLDEGVVQYCLDSKVPCYPGIGTATELQRAFNWGLRTVKFFPAESVGGGPLLRALAAPFPNMQFMPTGGITLQNLGSYLALPRVVAVGGSWMVKPEWIRDGHWEAVTQATSDALRTVAAAANPSPGSATRR